MKVAEDRATKTNKSVQEELDLIVDKLAALEGPSRGGTVSHAANFVECVFCHRKLRSNLQ